MLIIGTAISAATTGRMPLKIRTTTGESLNEDSAMAMMRMAMNEGSTEPRVAAMLPLTPLSLYPANIDMFTASTPGALCASATMSGISSSPIHPREHNSRCMIGIMA